MFDNSCFQKYFVNDASTWHWKFDINFQTLILVMCLGNINITDKYMNISFGTSMINWKKLDPSGTWTQVSHLPGECLNY